jgi:antitoxin component of MazEF toxin-antitoxin module
MKYSGIVRYYGGSLGVSLGKAFKRIGLKEGNFVSITVDDQKRIVIEAVK